MRRLLIAATLGSLAACASHQPPATPPAAQPAAVQDRTAVAGEAMITAGSHTLRYGGVGPQGIEFHEDDQPLVLPGSATTFPWQGRQIHILDAEPANLLYRVEPPIAGS